MEDRKIAFLSAHDGDYKTAIKYYSKILNTEKSSKIFRERADCYAALNKIDNAINDYTSAINIELDNPIYYCERAELYIQKSNYKAALDDCNDALEIDPNCSIAFLLKGIVLGELGDISSGISNISSCININKWCARAYYHRAVLKEKISKKDAKLDYWQAAHIGYSDALQRYRKLENIK